MTVLDSFGATIDGHLDLDALELRFQETSEEVSMFAARSEPGSAGEGTVLAPDGSVSAVTSEGSVRLVDVESDETLVTYTTDAFYGGLERTSDNPRRRSASARFVLTGR